MTSEEDKRSSTDRRAGNRRVAEDPNYNGPDRRKGDRRTDKDRRSD